MAVLLFVLLVIVNTFLRCESNGILGASCPTNLFLKNQLYCVRECGPGFFGNNVSRSCDKCDDTCRTCHDGDSSNRCSSCHYPLYIQGTSCVKSCGKQRSKGTPFRQIRLVGGLTHFEGRLEIFHNNEWGTICDDSWDINDAKVICRELLLGEASEAVTSGRLGQGLDSQPVWLSKVNCRGNETRLENCEHPAWGDHACGHFEDAGVRCAGPDTSRECVDTCGDGYFPIKEKMECGVCLASCLTCSNLKENCTSCDKPLFLKDGSCKSSCGQGFYGDPTDRKCKRCDPECRSCAEGTAPQNCTSCHDDRYLNGTQCLTSCAPLHVAQKRRIRLAGNRPTDFEGRVEVFRNGAWGTVCDQTFDFREASVVCRELGLGSAVKAVKKAAYGAGYGRMWADILNCTGQEASIFDCPFVARGFSSLCYQARGAGVICSGPRTRQVTNRCVKQCNVGWFKNSADVCDLCSSQCLECIGAGTRCTKCSAPKFLKDNTCVDKCGTDEFGYIPQRECRKCDKNVCVTCSDGSDKRNCSSCKEPKALKDGKCEDSCNPLFKKGGRCVSDCGVSMYKLQTNYTCQPCPRECIVCQYDSNSAKPVCTMCKPPLAFDNGACIANCTSGKYAVPIVNFSLPYPTVLRLRGGLDYLEGLLEVKHDGVWGTVCDDGWDFAETRVVCRELQLGDAKASSLSHVQKGTGKLWLDDVFCNGNENSLMKCRHRPWGQTNCNHNEDVALRCTGPGVRECKGTCPDGFFSSDKVCIHCNVSCKTCQDSANKCVTCADGYFKKNDTCVKTCGVGFYLNSSVCKPCDISCAECEGTPQNCTSCPMPMYRDKSKCVTDCKNGFKPSSLPLVRLVGGQTLLEGRVEVLHNGEYGTVCDDSWDINDAHVVCRMLNMGNATIAVSRAGFGSGKDKIWLDEVKCLGNESSLIQCPHNGWGIENCHHSEDAGVVCKGPNHSRDCIANCQIAGYYLNKTDNTCGKCSYDCKECDHSPENCVSCGEGKFLNRSGGPSNCVTHCMEGQYGDPRTNHCKNCSADCGDCFGVPKNCTSCKNGKHLYGTTCIANCSLAYKKMVSGVSDIRLSSNLNSTIEGRVEIKHDGIWGTVCDDGFGIQEAAVVCRQLKLGKPIKAVLGGKYGSGVGKIWMDDLQCTGNERRLQNCKFHSGGFGSNNCGHSEDAGVQCMGPDQSMRCVDDCGDGYYDDKNVCRRCYSKCKTCVGKADQCVSCPEGHFLKFTDCVVECPLGYYGNLKSRKCELCGGRCQTCFNSKRDDLCKSCPDGLFLKGLQCVDDCGEMKPVSSLFPAKPKTPLVRLVGGKNKQEGRVEVLYAGEWGTVCDDGWGIQQATIVCKELGFGKATDAPLHSKFGKGTGVIWMDNVDCFGYETSLTQCRQVGWGLGNCDAYHREDAGVVCDNTTVEEVSNNYCRHVNNGSCADTKQCDVPSRVTCVDLDMFNVDGRKESVCLQCPGNTSGDGRQCRIVSSTPPEFKEMPANRTVVQASNWIILKCVSKPPLVIPGVLDWRKDGKPLSVLDINSQRITSNSGKLLIRSATSDDSGNYTCTLVNSAGNITSPNAEVIVEDEPRILGIGTADVGKFDTANLSCFASCSPSCNITWKFKSVAVTPGDKFVFLDDVYTLQVKEVKFEDAGIYECTLVNDLGVALANVSLTVGLTVKYNSVPKEVVGTPGEDVTFSCSAEGVPTPKIAWKKGGDLVTNGSRHVVTSQGLVIRQITTDDMAVYSCIAWNRGSVRVSQAKLLLKAPPVITSSPSDLHVLSGANVTFNCVGLGFGTKPQPLWLKDSGEVKLSQRVRVSKETGSLQLFFVTVEDAGTYTCVFMNSYGEAKSSAMLFVDNQRTGIRALSQASGRFISTGTVVAIVVILVVIVVIILGIFMYKYRKRPSFQEYAVDGGGSSRPSKLASLRSRMKMGKSPPRNFYYDHNRDEVVFDDSKPFVYHDEL